MVVHEIETARLHLRPLTAADGEALHRLWTHPQVRRFLWDDEVIPAEQTASIIETSTRLFREQRFGLWGVTRREAADLIGFAGYWYFRDPPELELLYGIAAEHWSHGFATEVARALVRYGYDHLHFDVVHGSTDAANAASVRVLEKAGLHFTRRATTAGLDTVYYGCRRDAYEPDEASAYRTRGAGTES